MSSLIISLRLTLFLFLVFKPKASHGLFVSTLLSLSSFNLSCLSPQNFFL